VTGLYGGLPPLSTAGLPEEADRCGGPRSESLVGFAPLVLIDDMLGRPAAQRPEPAHRPANRQDRIGMGAPDDSRRSQIHLPPAESQAKSLALLSAAVVPELVSNLPKVAPHSCLFPWRVVRQLPLDRGRFLLEARAMLKMRLAGVQAR
jgi:hypothetical protein